MKSLVLLSLFVLTYARLGGRSTCYCFPGDSCWPSTSAWAQLNTTVGGRLIATVPIGTPCHDPNYDAAACIALQGQWTLPQTQQVGISKRENNANSCH